MRTHTRAKLVACGLAKKLRVFTVVRQAGPPD